MKKPLQMNRSAAFCGKPKLVPAEEHQHGVKMQRGARSQVRRRRIGTPAGR